jgi:hypothetical protein
MIKGKDYYRRSIFEMKGDISIHTAVRHSDSEGRKV